jgi:hypothetical protein
MVGHVRQYRARQGCVGSVQAGFNDGRRRRWRSESADTAGSARRSARLWRLPAEVLDPEGAAETILRRLDDAGFKVVPAARLWAIVTGITS